MQYDNNNRGSLWRNDKKQAGDEKPHFTGKAQIGGIDYRISCWKTDPHLVEENPRRPLLTFKVESEADFQKRVQQVQQQGMQQAQAVMQPQAQSYAEASGGMSQTPAQQTQSYYYDDDIPF